ncbi:hypothetical protein GCM10023153_07420 [Ornithinibacter aureus]|uniref:Uncharacterized protein n=1 Tax=Ornithinibacter aureus TaxID=622664 RepID=A0ABP8JGB6_9MICO
MLDGGHEVGQRLPGAGARLDEQVALRVDGVRDGLCHLDLTGPLGAAHSPDGGMEEVGQRRHQSRVCRRAQMAITPIHRSVAHRAPGCAMRRVGDDREALVVLDWRL